MEQKKRVSVIGLGYIGLPTAALLASNGHDVVGMDVSAHAVATINQGKIHIVEPDLDAHVRSGVAAGRLSAFSEVQPADVYLICVPTPFHDCGHIPQPNIDYVLAATASIAPLVKAGDLVILESTSPVGTTEQMQAVLQVADVAVADVHIAYCPERVLPGKIMTELVENDRVVGGITPEATRACPISIAALCVAKCLKLMQKLPKCASSPRTVSGMLISLLPTSCLYFALRKASTFGT